MSGLGCKPVGVVHHIDLRAVRDVAIAKLWRNGAPAVLELNGADHTELVRIVLLVIALHTGEGRPALTLAHLHMQYHPFKSTVAEFLRYRNNWLPS